VRTFNLNPSKKLYKLLENNTWGGQKLGGIQGAKFFELSVRRNEVAFT